MGQAAAHDSAMAEARRLLRYSRQMRLLAGALAGAMFFTGCATDAYRIPKAELARISIAPPEVRGNRVRVIEEIKPLDAPDATRVEAGDVVIIPDIHISTGIQTGGGGGGAGGGRGVGSIGGSGGDSKGAAILFVVLAASALFIAAGVEGSRFDGWARLHPMHPVHLFGKDGSYAVAPLAGIDPSVLTWAERAYVRPTEGPWLELDRAPLWRQGFTYSMYGGASSMRSVAGDTAMGTAFTIQGGYFPTQELGIQATVFLGWRDNRVGETLFDSRYTLEATLMPLQVSVLSAGIYAGGGLGYRYEDGLKGGNQGEDGSTTVLTTGLQLQLELHTRIALTARMGIARAHDEHTTDLMVGLSVY